MVRTFFNLLNSNCPDFSYFIFNLLDSTCPDFSYFFYNLLNSNCPDFSFFSWTVTIEDCYFRFAVLCKSLLEVYAYSTRGRTLIL